MTEQHSDFERDLVERLHRYAGALDSSRDLSAEAVFLASHGGSRRALLPVATVVLVAIVIGLGVSGRLPLSIAPPMGDDPTTTLSSSPGPASPEPTPGEVPLEPATRLLDCDATPSEVGGWADEFGPQGGGTEPDQALSSFLAGTSHTIPRVGYEPLKVIGDRHHYVYRVDGRIKVVVIVSPRFGSLVNRPYTIDELRTCDVAEYGPLVDLGPEQRAWTDDDGRIISDIAGSPHCWADQGVRLLHIEAEDPDAVRQYVRDPLGTIRSSGWKLRADFAVGVELPPDAAFSGYRSGDLELWLVPDDHAAYVVSPDGVERWPRAEEPVGCV